MSDLVNGGSTHLSFHIHVLFRPDEPSGDFRFDGPTLTPDPLGRR